jgi:hypothetical protein
MNPIRSLTLSLSLALAAASAMPAAADPAPAAPHEAEAGSPLAMGHLAPMRDTPMKNVDGRDVTIGGAAGKKGTLVLFICNHCPWVKAWQTRIAGAGNSAVPRGIGVIAINPNDPAAYPEDGFEEMKARARQVGYKFPYVVDATSDVARAFGATHTPEAYLFDAQGRLVYHGAVDDNAHDEKAVTQRWLRRAVDAVVSGNRVPAAETKALGCGIKFRRTSSS